MAYESGSRTDVGRDKHCDVTVRGWVGGAGSQSDAATPAASTDSSERFGGAVTGESAGRTGAGAQEQHAISGIADDGRSGASRPHASAQRVATHGYVQQFLYLHKRRSVGHGGVR